ncbi:MAG: DUF126 domain-containing protein [Roseiarcus sp.]
MTVLAARCLVEGEAEGALALWSAPLSFWGGFDAASGRVVDRTHPAFGDCVSGRVLAMPSGRGSSSASSVLAEAIRRGTAPAAIILASGDPILVVGAIVARRLYGRACPIVVCAAEDFAMLADGRRARVVAHGDSCAIFTSDDQSRLVSRVRSGGLEAPGKR